MEKDILFKPKSIGIVGAGPVGCIVAAFLAKAGCEVTLCDIFPKLTEPINQNGIKISGTDDFTQKITRTCNDVEELKKFNPDVIFLTVKANALPLLASAIESFHKEGMYVVSWQNGIDTELELANVIGRKNTLRAVVNYGCGLLDPGHAHIYFHHKPHYIQELSPETKVVAESIANILTKGGLTTNHTNDLISMIWRKGILNACMSPVCAITRQTMSQAMGDPIIFQLVDSLIKEGVNVARANEINVGWDFYPHAIQYLGKAGNHKPSMLMDIETNRRTEIDFINGKIIEYGKRTGIKTPYNNTIRSLVKAIEPK